MSRIPAGLRREVMARAAGHCEYCLRSELITLYSHEVDHIIALKHGGETVEANLCCAVPIATVTRAVIWPQLTPKRATSP